MRAADLGLLAAAGVTELESFAPPRVGIVSTGDEVVPPATAKPAAGQVRDACAPALAGLVREAGGEPVLRGIVPDDADALERVLAEAVGRDDVVVVSAGSSVGARDLTATVVGRLGEVVCHGLALKAQIRERVQQRELVGRDEVAFGQQALKFPQKLKLGDRGGAHGSVLCQCAALSGSTQRMPPRGSLTSPR